MSLRPGQMFYAQFTTASPTSGAGVNADALPGAVLTRNGVDDAAVVLAVTNLAAARYVASGTIPATYGAGDIVDVVVTATVGGITGKAVVASHTIDPSSPAGSRVVSQDYNGAGSLRVQDGSGSPVAGATVTAFLLAQYNANPQSAPAQGQTRTDASGNWTLFLSPGNYVVVASLGGETSAMGYVTVS